MLCKFCNAEIGESRRFCPECGKPLTEEAEASVQTVEETTEEPITDEAEVELAEEIAAPIPAEPAEENAAPIPAEPAAKKAKKGNTGTLILLIVGLVAVIALLAVILLQSFGISLFPEKDKTTQEDTGSKETYSADAEIAAEAADTVVGEIEAYQIDNGLLQVFFVEEFETFLMENYNYLAYLGLDLSKALSEQMCYFDDTMTWEQFLVNASLESWKSYIYMVILANQNGFTLDAEWQGILDTMEDSLQKDAEKNGYENADDLLKERYGETCNVEIYKEYVELIFRANAFYASQLAFTDEQIATAFEENEAALEDKGITKSGKLKSSVRHLLVMPEGGTTDESGKTSYTEAEWQDCLTQAEALLQQWKDGEATEESFSKLVAEHTDDTASASTGGLYEGILNDGTYMEEFQNWAVDPQRQTGETGIVKTTAGYHIMYFVSGEQEWMHYAEAILQEARAEELQKQMEAIQTKNPAKINLSDVVIESVF